MRAPSKPPSLRILLVEDERPQKLLLHRDLPESGPLLVTVRGGEDLAEVLAEEPFDVSQVDFELPGIGRVETRRRRGARKDGDDGDDETDPGADVDLVLIRREKVLDGDLDGEGAAEDDEPSTDELLAEEVLAAMGVDESEGDFLTKPMRRAEIRRILAATGEEDEAGSSPKDSEKEAKKLDGGGPILGQSRAMTEILEVVERIAKGSASVLIHGETGTGKTIVARRIHDLSPRRDRRFVAINCSAFQEQLLESELFGHEKGSFTGATRTKEGLFAAADGGTLFLDEIGDMSPAMQAKLLQVLDDGAYRRVGGTETHRVDVRVVAASNKDLPGEVRKDRFREDLLFRLNVISLEMPPLRERRDDIPVLIEYFLARHRLQGQARKQVSPEALQILRSYDWPGNVRELANTVEGLILLSPGPEIRARDLPQALRPKSEFELADSETPLPMKEVERLHVQRTLRHTEGKKAPAARLLGIDIKTLNSKIEKYEIELP